MSDPFIFMCFKLAIAIHLEGLFPHRAAAGVDMHGLSRGSRVTPPYVACAAPEVQMILQDDKAESLTPSSSDFWFTAAALRDFVQGEGGGVLPIEVRHHRWLLPIKSRQDTLTGALFHL